MIHISQLADERVENVEDVLKVDDVVFVKVIEVGVRTPLLLSAKHLAISEEGAPWAACIVMHLHFPTVADLPVPQLHDGRCPMTSRRPKLLCH